MTAAKRHGVVVSYDLNYRPSLWRAVGGQGRAPRRSTDGSRRNVDVMIGNEEDFTAALGFEVAGRGRGSLAAGRRCVRAMVGGVGDAYPNLRVIATTLRGVRSATVNDWGAIAWSRATGVVRATQRDSLEILDRVGGGDSFASGLIYGLLEGAAAATWRSSSGRRTARSP